MTRPAVILMAVAGYAFAETIILWTLAVPHLLYYPTPYQKTVAFGQLLLIPGMAAVMSRVMYGPYQWLRRTSTILLCGILSVPVAIISLFLLLLPVWILVRSYEVSRILFALALPVVALGVLTALVFLVRRSGRWSVKAETERWLAERHAGTSQRDRIQRSRSIRFAVCIPTLLVLPMFLFLPETWGILSHVEIEASKLSGYRVTIPATWVIMYHRQSADGGSVVSGICGEGIGRGINPLRYDSLAWWGVGTWGGNDDQWLRKYHNPPEGSEILDRRELTVGGETMTCLDYWPTYTYSPARSESTRIAHVSCEGSRRLNANFDGIRSELPAFYNMLGLIKPVP